MDSQLSLTLECIVRAGEEWRHIPASKCKEVLAKDSVSSDLERGNFLKAALRTEIFSKLCFNVY